MSGILNTTGASSGIIGTTAGTPDTLFYEEGSCTLKQSAGGTLFTAMVARYIKVSGLVNVWFDVQGYDSDDRFIYNLPFTAVNNTPAGSCDINYNNVDNDMMGRVDANTTRIILSLGTGSPAVDSSTRIIGHTTYRAA
jgi:hypothetical protein